MTELEDCPMCGCKATFVKHSAGISGTQGYDSWHAVACKHCRTTVGACDRRFREKEDAAKAWNLRIPTPERESSVPDHLVRKLASEVVFACGGNCSEASIKYAESNIRAAIAAAPSSQEKQGTSFSLNSAPSESCASEDAPSMPEAIFGMETDDGDSVFLLHGDHAAIEQWIKEKIAAQTRISWHSTWLNSAEEPFQHVYLPSPS